MTPIGRPVADIIGERFDPAEPRRLKKSAQAPTRIGLGDPCYTPELLANVVEAPRTSRQLTRKNETAVFHGCCANYAAALCDAPKLRYDSGRIAERLEHRVAKNGLERRVVKRQPSTIGSNAGEVIKPE